MVAGLDHSGRIRVNSFDATNDNCKAFDKYKWIERSSEKEVCSKDRRGEVRSRQERPGTRQGR